MQVFKKMIKPQKSQTISSRGTELGECWLSHSKEVDIHPAYSIRHGEKHCVIAALQKLQAYYNTLNPSVILSLCYLYVFCCIASFNLIMRSFKDKGRPWRMPDLQKHISYGFWSHCRNLTPSTSRADLSLKSPVHSLLSPKPPGPWGLMWLMLL